MIWIGGVLILGIYNDVDLGLSFWIVVKKVAGMFFTLILMGPVFLYFIGSVKIFQTGIYKNINNFNYFPPKMVETAQTFIKQYHLVNSYGLFRRMTGVDGRYELTFYGSNDRKSWKAYDFYYKPTRTERIPSFTGPHQPRLDWQLWFSALNKGIKSSDHYIHLLLFRLLHNSESVLSLLKHNPFPDDPPQFLKVSRQIYTFTDFEEDKYIPKKWWMLLGRRKQYVKTIQVASYGCFEP
jgi:hypothetical protein